MITTNASDAVVKTTQDSSRTQAKPAFPRPIFLILLFVVVFVAVRLTIRPINSSDYKISNKVLLAIWHGESPYAIPDYYFQPWTVTSVIQIVAHVPYTIPAYYNPPWTAFLLAPLVNQPLETWLALTVAIFVVSTLDRGHPSALLLLAHPIFIALLASSNWDWVIVGTGVWLLELMPRGWGRGVAWLFLASKPQSTWIVLVIDGIMALRQRDWKPFVLAMAVAVVTFALTPMPLKVWSTFSGTTTWSLPILFNYGVPGALLASAFVLLVRWQRRGDYKSLGLILSLIWTPYALQYAFMPLLFIMRKAGWLRIVLFVLAGIVLAAAFWDEYHVQEEIGAAAMLLLAAIMAPSNEQTIENPIKG